MKIQISFMHNNKHFQYTIDDELVEIGTNEMWEHLVEGNENEDKSVSLTEEECNICFEINANFVYIAEKDKQIISGDGMYINVYHSLSDMDFYDTITDIEVLYA